VEEVAVMGPVVDMVEVVAMVEVVEVGVMVEAVVVATVHMVAHMEAEGLDIKEETMGDMVGVVMEGQEDMEEAVVDQDMGVVQELPMEETASMEEQAGQAGRSHGVMTATALGR
jgi:uncharacterized membrane protein (DUF106 family)